MTDKKTATTTNLGELVEFASLRGYVTNPSYCLVPDISYYGEKMRNGKDALYENFLQNTSPDDTNTDAFVKSNRAEAEAYATLVDRDMSLATLTGNKILRMQNADVYEIEGSLYLEIEFCQYLSSLMNHYQEANHERNRD